VRQSRERGTPRSGRRIGPDSIVMEWQQFVAGCRQPHGSDPMESGIAVEIATWKLKLEFRLQL